MNKKRGINTLRIGTALFACSSLLLSCQSPNNQAVKEKPNILFLFADDQHAGT